MRLNIIRSIIVLFLITFLFVNTNAYSQETIDEVISKMARDNSNSKTPGFGALFSFGFTAAPVIAGGLMINFSSGYDFNIPLGKTGAIIAFSGLTFGPLAGYIYGNVFSKSWALFIPRLLIGIPSMIGFGVGSWEDLNIMGPFLIAVVTGPILLILDIFDFARVYRKIRDSNSRSSLNISPLILSRNDSRTYGFQLSFAF